MLDMLKLLPIGAQIGIALAVLTAIGGGSTAIYVHIYDKGAASEAAKQKERDDEAIAQAAHGRAIVRSCRDAGGVWSQARGICQRG